MITCYTAWFNGLPVTWPGGHSGTRDSCDQKQLVSNSVRGEIWLRGSKTGQSRTAVGPLTMNVTERGLWCEPNRIEAHVEIPAVSSGRRGRLHVSQGQTGRDLNTDGQSDASDFTPKAQSKDKKTVFFISTGFFFLVFLFLPREKRS